MITLSELRKQAGFSTQAALAEKLGLKSGRAVIAQWEIGAAYPRTMTMQALANALNVTSDDIIAAITAAKESSA